MKKFLALLLALTMAMSLVACGSSGDDTTGDTTDDSTPTEETGVGAADVKIGLICVHDINSGYDAAHIEGLTTACEELGINVDSQMCIRDSLWTASQVPSVSYHRAFSSSTVRPCCSTQV